MPSEEEPAGVHIDSVETWDGVLRSERLLEVRGTGIIVTHRIQATGTTPVKFQLIDPLPGSLHVEEIGFHPDYEPPHGRVDGDRAVMSGVVTADQPLLVKYGLCPSQPKRPEEIEDLQIAVPPSIEFSEAVDDIDHADAELETATMTRSAGPAESTTGEGNDIFARLKRSLWKDDQLTEPETGSGSGESPSGPDRGSADESSGPARTDQGGHGPADEADAEAGRDDDGEPSEAGRDADRSSAGPTDDPDQLFGQGDPFGATEADTSLAAAISRAASEREAIESATTDETDREPEAANHEAVAREGTADEPVEPDIVRAFVGELEAGKLSNEERQRLARQIGRVLAETEDTPKSIEVRIRELESTVQSFAAYVSALEAIIDQHGPADEFLAEVRRDISTLESSVEKLEAELGRASTDRESFDERLDAVSDEVALLDSRVNRTTDRLNSLRSAYRSKVEKLEGAIESLEPRVEKVDRLEGEIEVLKGEIETAEARRRAIIKALSRED